MFSAARMQIATEEHGAGRQYLRFRIRPRFSIAGLWLIAIIAAIGCMAALDGAWIVAVIFALTSILLALRTIFKCGSTSASLIHAVRDCEGIWTVAE